MDDQLQVFRRQLRAARGTASQREFSIRIGTTQQTLGKWERGESVPRGIGVRRELERAGVRCPVMIAGPVE